MKKVLSRAEISSLVFPGLEISARSKRAEKPHVIAFKFQPGLKYDLGHAHRLSCECKTFLQPFPAQF